MGSERIQTGLKLSIVDRIIGFDRDNRSQPFRPGQSATVRELEETLHRDLTSLLNTRRPDEVVPPDFEEARASLLTFGLPDFTACSALDRTEHERFRRAIETAIRVFEPRLSNVTVSIARLAKKGERSTAVEVSLRYHVRALLRIEPEPEPVVFDAVLEPGTGRVAVEAATPTRNANHAR